MLIGYVSDERYVALADVLIEFDRGGRVRRGRPLDAARGGLRRCSRRATYRRDARQGGLRPEACHRDVGGGRRRTSSGSCRTACSATSGRAGRGRASSREFRVHSVEPYRLSLWRYGCAQGVRPAARLVRRARPARHDADHAGRRLHADRRPLEQRRLRPARSSRSSSPRRSAPASTTSTRRASRARSSPSRGSSRRPRRRRRSPCWPRPTPGTPTTTSAAAATTSTPTGCPPRRSSTPGRN